MSIQKLKTKFSNGAFILDVKHYFTKINEIIDSLNSLVSSSGSTYKSYTALVTQVGTSAPTPVILGSNTIGNIVYSRNSVGDYNLTLSSAFTLDKTFTLIAQEDTSGGYVKLKRVNNNTLNITTNSTDGILNSTSVEIRVYN